MVRSPDVSNDSNGLKKGPWTPEEDRKLIDYMQKHGQGSWQLLPKKAGLNRCGKSCRLRWTNYLRPDIKRGNFSLEEEQIIINLHSVLGNKWSTIATQLEGRTDNEIKNYWNTHLRKKLLQSGIDPKTHQPITDLNFLLNSPHSNLYNPLENLAKIQLLHNIIQILKPNSILPNISEPSFLIKSSQILANNQQLDGIINGISKPFQHSPLFENLDQPMFNDNQTILDNFGMIQEIPHSKINNGITLPALLPATPQTSSFNQFDTIDSMQNVFTNNNSFLNSDDSNDLWRTIMDDEANGFFWKDIFNAT